MEQNICETAITDLNNDCIGVIFRKYLKKRDQVEFALTCQRFKDIFELHCKAEHSNVKIQGLLQEDWPKYFKVTGSLIKSIDIYFESDVEELISKYCPNVEKIEYSYLTIKKSLNVFKNLKLLQRLRFEYCCFDDDVISALTEIPTIEELIIETNYEITGKYLSGFKHLKTISLANCPELKCEHLAEISMQELETLEITDCNAVSVKDLLELTKHASKLIEFSYTCNESMDNNHKAYRALLAQLSNLRKLDVCNFSEPFLKALIEHNSDKLEDLTLILNNNSQYDYRKIVTKYKNLKKLRLYLCQADIRDFVPLENLEEICFRFCNTFTEGIIDMLKKCPKLFCITVDGDDGIIDEKLLSEWIKLVDKKEDRKGPIQLRLAKDVDSSKFESSFASHFD